MRFARRLEPRYAGTVTDPYPLRTLLDGEFGTWAHSVSTAYGHDLREADIADGEATIELDRAIGAFDGDVPIAGAAMYSRSMTIPGAVQPIAAVTWVGVAPTHRRRGILTAMMRWQLHRLHEAGAEPIAVLASAEATIYGRYGYGVASRLARLDGERGAMQLRCALDADRGTIRLLRGAEARPLMRDVYEAVRVVSVGWLDRPDKFWDARLYDAEHNRHGASAFWFAVHEDPGGIPTGYAIYRLRDHTTVQIMELVAATRQAYAAVWRFLIGIDLHPRITFDASLDEPLQHMLVNPRVLRSTLVDNLWVRLVDVDRALATRRYATALDVVIDVMDEFCPWNTGRYRLRAGGDRVTCERTQAAADLRLTSRELGAIFLGGTTLASLAAAGLVEELRPGAVAAGSLAFRGQREPYHPSGADFPAY